MTESCAISALCAADIYSVSGCLCCLTLAACLDQCCRRLSLCNPPWQGKSYCAGIYTSMRMLNSFWQTLCTHAHAGNCIQSLAVCSENMFHSSLLTNNVMHVQVARQGSMAEQQMHQQQLKALHDDLQAVRVNTCRLAYLDLSRPLHRVARNMPNDRGCCNIPEQLHLATFAFHNKLHPFLLVILQGTRPLHIANCCACMVNCCNMA